MCNTYIANSEWRADPEHDITKISSRGFVLRQFAANDCSTYDGARYNHENEEICDNEADLGIEEGFRTRASTSVYTGQHIDSIHTIIIIITNWHMQTIALTDEDIGHSG